MNEAETRAELIDPKLKANGWGIVDGSKILRERNVCKITAETKKSERIYQQKMEDLEELKKSILQKAFNGEL